MAREHPILRWMEVLFVATGLAALAWCAYVYIDAHDSVYCVRLAQAAAHAGMAGRTDMVVGRRHNRFVHVPIDIVVSQRNEVAPDGDLWLSVLESTAQPLEMR